MRLALSRLCLVVPGLLGCGRLGFDDATAVDTDATVPLGSARCWDKWKPGQLSVAAPQRIAGLGNYQHENPSISADGLTLYFERNDASDDLYMAHRATRDAPWSAVSRIDALASSSNEGRLSTSSDGMFAVFTSSRGGNQDLWTTQRSAPDGPFEPPTQALVMSLRSAISEIDPELSADGLRLYYAPYAAGVQDIRFASREPAGVFTMSAVLDELRISSAVGDPALSPDETVIAFSSGATGAENDLYFAVRAARGARFETPTMIPTINLPNINDGDIALSNDGCEIFFRSDRNSTAELFVALVQ